MKKLLIIPLLLFSLFSNSQDEIRFVAYQDARLAVAKDKTGTYTPFTLDVVLKLNLCGKQDRLGYFVVSPYFEYAEIDGLYKRYALEIGYVFNTISKRDIDYKISLNYGIQDRWRLNWLVIGADFEISFKISKIFRGHLMAQFVQRKDLDFAYGGTNIGSSGFVGLSAKLF